MKLRTAALLAAATAIAPCALAAAGAARPFRLDLSGEWTCAGTNFTGKAREHRMEIAIDNTAQYGAVMKAHGFGEWMQSVWNGAIGRIELREANPLGVVSR